MKGSQGEFEVYDDDGRSLEVGTFVYAAGLGVVVAFGDFDIDYVDELERAAMIRNATVTVEFVDGQTETFQTGHEPPRWMYDDALRFNAEDLRDPKAALGGDYMHFNWALPPVRIAGDTDLVHAIDDAVTHFVATTTTEGTNA